MVEIKTNSGICLDYHYGYEYPQFEGKITEAENGYLPKVM